jgi:transcriptional regulator with XRE-family HTH domain
VIDDPLPRPYLREWREARGMTQQALAVASGLTVSDIARHETSERGRGWRSCSSSCTRSI